MKKLLPILLLSLMGLAACKEECRVTTCLHGNCDRGDCICETSWEGEQCNEPANYKFLGRLITPGGCNLTIETDTITATRGETNYEIYFKDLNGLRFTGIVDSLNTNIFTIPEQDVWGSSGSVTVSGSGEYNPNKVEMTMTYTRVSTTTPPATGYPSTCSGVWEKN